MILPEVIRQSSHPGRPAGCGRKPSGVGLTHALTRGFFVAVLAVGPAPSRVRVLSPAEMYVLSRAWSSVPWCALTFW
jgi:hypothetical protein